MNDMLAFRRSAEAIERRVLQLEQDGVAGPQLVPAMAACLPDLDQIWNYTTNAQLAELCRDYPAFYRYANVMEVATEADRREPAAMSKQLGTPLPGPLRSQLLNLLKAAATLDGGYQSLLDAGRSRNMTPYVRLLDDLHRRWRDEKFAFLTALHTSGTPARTVEFLSQALERFGERITRLAAHAQP
ncbi:hypothetical protein [Burkholderia ubonensis]|uniref:hypothetical protein n=1 Tax=Burkholderia ubonensis TaxID=101571 RepID=UPI000754D5F1|nr:hypothetical protein [Burkholderia ubonensis]KVW33181.1 hypothetical protein WK94_32475 [Burkholderia ubonensis]